MMAGRVGKAVLRSVAQQEKKFGCLFREKLQLCQVYLLIAAGGRQTAERQSW